MSEFFFDEDEDRVSFIQPDEKGFTLRTQFKGTQGVLDRNAMLRADTSPHFRDALGGHVHHVGAIPIEIYEQIMLRLGRHPTADECLHFLQARDFSKLKTRDARLGKADTLGVEL